MFQQVYRATLAIKYMVASCNTLICTKTSGDQLIYNGIYSKLVRWILTIARSNPQKYGKYANLVIMENTFFLLE